MVKLVPLPKETRRRPGAFEGKMSSTPDEFEPLTDEEMKEFEFERCPKGRRQVSRRFENSVFSVPQW